MVELSTRLPLDVDLADHERISIKKYKFMDRAKEEHDLRGEPSERRLHFGFFNLEASSNPPLQRPARLPHTSSLSTRFVGRETELRQLLDVLKPAHVVTLCGAAGIGKSALAAEAVSRLMRNDSPADDSPSDLFPDGIIYHDFSQEPQVTKALSKIARAFGDDPQRGTPARAARRALAGRQALLVLDSTEKADDLAALLAVRAGCGVLMTSRQRKDALAERLDLRPLPLDDAVELLFNCLKSNVFVPWDIILDHKRARTICDLLGRWPFALCLAAHDLQKADLDDYLHRLKQNSLDTLDQGQEPSHSVPRFLAQSLEQVSPKAQQALAVVGMLANAPFNREAVAKLLDMRVYQAGHLLSELVNYGFLVQQERQYQVAHRLIYSYAQQHLTLRYEQDHNKSRKR